MERRRDLDLLRAVSAVGVVGVHAAAGAVVRGPQSAGETGYVVAVVIDYLGHTAVPLFFALAGWVLLAGKPVASSADLTRRILRVLVPFAVWSVVYAAWALRDTTLLEAARLVPAAVLGAPVSVHLWFVYPYLAVLAGIGAVTLAVRKVVPVGALVLLGVVSVMPFAAAVAAGRAGFVIGSSMWAVPVAWLACALAGWLLLSGAGRFSGWARGAAGAGLAVASVVAVVLSWTIGYQEVLAAAGPLVLGGAVLVCVLLRGVAVRGRAGRAAGSLAGASYGVYLSHILVLQALTMGLALVSPALGGARAWWSIPLLTAATVAVSWALVTGWTRLRLARVLG